MWPSGYGWHDGLQTLKHRSLRPTYATFCPFFVVGTLCAGFTRQLCRIFSLEFNLVLCSITLCTSANTSAGHSSSKSSLQGGECGLEMREWADSCVCVNYLNMLQLVELSWGYFQGGGETQTREREREVYWRPWDVWSHWFSFHLVNWQVEQRRPLI